MSRPVARALAACRIAALAMMVAAPAAAQRSLDVGFQQAAESSEAPKELEGLAVTDRRGQSLPMQATLRDESGQPVTLASLFADGRPRLLQLGYMKCPMLCSLALNGLVRGMQGLDWSVGDQFDVLFISINPAENAELAAAKRKGYAAEYGRAGGEKGWRFLTGDASTVRGIAEAVGFPYRLMPDGEYAHPAAVFAITGDGRLSQYLPGVAPTSADLRLALTGAGEGRLGSTFDQFVFWCHQFDPTKGGYVLWAFRVMQVGGGLTVVAMAATLFLLHRREARQRRLAPPSDGIPSKGVAHPA
ncbi:MAG: SCO family protein [Planctomycetes bacterium]|nr:SCO family protein [Planctomycetota bacterium]